MISEQLRGRLNQFVQQTDFLMTTRSEWMRFASQLRNPLHNDLSRFEIARSKIIEYRYALATLEGSQSQDDDMALELRLRGAALDAYSACLDRMEASGGDFTAEFVRLRKDEMGNASAGDPGYPNDVLFSFEIYGLEWSFGALDVLNRLTRHFLVSCGPGREVAESYRKWRGDINNLNQEYYRIRNAAHHQGTASEVTPRYYEFFAEVRTAIVARTQLEETAQALSTSDIDAGDQPRFPPSLFPSPCADGHYNQPFGGATRSDNCRWSSGLAHEAICSLLAREALAPTFAAFPTLPVPALIRVFPGSKMDRRALLRTRATPQQLLQWGFLEDAAAGVATVDAAEAIAAEEARLDRLDMLQAPKEQRGRRRGTRQQQREEDGWAWQRGAKAGLGCPADIWDVPPNDFWHPLAEAAAASEWERLEADALASPGSLGSGHAREKGNASRKRQAPGGWSTGGGSTVEDAPGLGDDKGTAAG